MRGRDTDGRDTGPLPPHERPWRHPAEIAAEQNSRRDTLPPAPPLRRRTTAVVAVASMCASLLLVTLVLPSESGNGADPPTAAAVGDQKVVKNAALESRITVDGRPISVVVVGDGILATSIDAVGTASSIPTGNGDGIATVIGRDDETGLAFLAVDGWADASVLPSIPAATVAESAMVTMDPEGREVPCHPSLTTNDYPVADRAAISTESPITGASVVSDALGTPLGIAVDNASGTWMFSRTAIEAALARASGNG